MKDEKSREWLQVNRMCRDLKWLAYNPDYKDIDIKCALEILESLKKRIEKDLNK